MRRRGRIDRNQPDIVKALRRAGASVAVTSAVGAGFPDIVVGFRGENFLLEIKDGRLPPCERRLTEREQEFHRGWSGAVCVVESVDQALRAIGAVDVTTR